MLLASDLPGASVTRANLPPFHPSCQIHNADDLLIRICQAGDDVKAQALSDAVRSALGGVVTHLKDSEL